MKDQRTVSEMLRDWNARGDRNMIHPDGRSIAVIIATAMQMEAVLVFDILEPADVCVEYEKALFVAKREYMRDIQRRLEEKCTDLFSVSCKAEGFGPTNKQKVCHV